MKALNLFGIGMILGLALIAGCAQFGYTKASDVTHGVAYSRASLTTGYDTIARLVTSGDMKASSRDAHVQKLDTASKLIDATEVATRATPQEIAVEVIKWAQVAYTAWSVSDANMKFVSNLIDANAGGPLTAEQSKLVQDRMLAARALAVAAVAP
jgi:hypothetical protein